jgi:hypothetical protein
MTRPKRGVSLASIVGIVCMAALIALIIVAAAAD